MNKQQVLRQVRNLSRAQCKQLEVEEPFEGEATVEAVMAWLGDSLLYGADGTELDLPAIFAAADPAALSLHSGYPADDESGADEMVATEEVMPINVPAVEEAMELQADTQASIRRGVRDAVRKNLGRSGLPATRSIATDRLGKKSKHFDSKEDQFVAGQWIGAKIMNIPSAKKWWNANGSSYGQKQQVEDPNSAGGFLVPDPLEAAILDVREEYGTCRKLARTFPMTADSLNIPSLTTGATVEYPAEAAAIVISDAVWANVSLVAVKRACLMKWSNELGADALFSLADTLADYIGRALGIREDTEWIQGDGTAAFGSVTGLGNLAGRLSVDGAGGTWADLILDDFANVVGTLPDKHHAGASWVMSRQFFGQAVLRVIADAGGNTIDSLGQGSSGAQLLGYPVNFSDQAPIATALNIECAYFGNWQDATVFGDRSGVEIATSEHVDFANDLINIRGISRYDINNHDNQAYVCLSTT